MKEEEEEEEEEEDPGLPCNTSPPASQTSPR